MHELLFFILIIAGYLLAALGAWSIAGHLLPSSAPGEEVVQLLLSFAWPVAIPTILLFILGRRLCRALIRR